MNRPTNTPFNNSCLRSQNHFLIHFLSSSVYIKTRFFLCIKTQFFLKIPIESWFRSNRRQQSLEHCWCWRKTKWSKKCSFLDQTDEKGLKKEKELRFLPFYANIRIMNVYLQISWWILMNCYWFKMTGYSWVGEKEFTTSLQFSLFSLFSCLSFLRKLFLPT